MALVSLLLLLGVIVTPIYFIQSRHGWPNHLRGSWTKKLLALYTFVLIGALVVAMLLPPFKSSESRTIKDDIMFNDSLYTKIQTGEIDEIEDLSLAKRWHYPYAKQELKMKIDHSGFNGLMLFAKHVEALDGASTIEVDYYRSQTYIGNRDVTAHMSNPTVNLKDDTLIIVPPVPVNFKGTSIEKEFITKQFHSDEIKSRIYDQGIMIGREVIILHVPENIEVFTGDESLQWIND